jgi:hypothetical protein
MAKVCSIVIVKVRLTNISSYDSNTISTWSDWAVPWTGLE